MQAVPGWGLTLADHSHDGTNVQHAPDAVHCASHILARFISHKLLLVVHTYPVTNHNPCAPISLLTFLLLVMP